MKQTFTKFLGGALCALLLLPSSAFATITVNWDWENNIPSTIRNTVAEGTDASGSFASDVDGITLDYYGKVAGTYVKLQPVGGKVYAQFNANTAFRIPVVSTSDKITIKTYEGQHNYTFDGDAATEDEHTYSITASQVATGYVEVVSTAYMNIYSVKAVLAHKPIEVVAKWTFDTGYDYATGVYTPNTSDWSEVGWKWGNSDKVVANSAFTNRSQCTASAKTDRAWGLRNNNGDKIFALYTSEGTVNDISDYTVASSHNQYVEFAFPTTGLQDITVSFDYTYNDGTSTLELVYSPDGGTTWVDKGAYASGANWYTYASHNVAINAANATKVIVRLIEANGLLKEMRINSFTVKGKRATTSVDVTSALYATYYNSIPVELPANLQAATIDGETSGTLTLNWRYAEGDVIPGGTPVLLKATAADTYNLIYAADNTEAAPAGNLLHGSDVATTTTGGDKYYALQYGTGANASVLGFYYINAGGAAFTSGAHKAWLALPAASREFFEIDDEVTAIKNIKVGTEDNVYYDLQGRRVFYPTKGLYIVNGKKVVLK